MDRPAILLVYLTFLALVTQETSGVSRQSVYIDYSFRVLRVDIFVGSYQKGVRLQKENIVVELNLFIRINTQGCKIN
jgi:hypothetical protein